MKVGIIVAMGKELRLLLHLIENLQTIESNGFTLHIGQIGKHKICAMQCGIGKVNAAIGTMTLIDAYSPELVINTGVAGGASEKVCQMDIVIGESIAYHDVWCGPGTKYGEASGCPLLFESDTNIITLLKSSKFSDNLKFGLVCSGDKFISQKEEIEFIQSNFPKVLAVDMESAAIAQTCFVKHIPVFIARIVSDTPGKEHDNVQQYENFWDSAPEHTFHILSSILKNLE